MLLQHLHPAAAASYTSVACQDLFMCGDQCLLAFAWLKALWMISVATQLLLLLLKLARTVSGDTYGTPEELHCGVPCYAFPPPPSSPFLPFSLALLRQGPTPDVIVVRRTPDAHYK
jgi:hypothetical protein